VSSRDKDLLLFRRSFECRSLGSLPSYRHVFTARRRRVTALSLNYRLVQDETLLTGLTGLTGLMDWLFVGSYAELVHSGLQSGSLHTEQGGGPVHSANHPVRLLQSANDVVAFCGLKRGYAGMTISV
jgi:hypothetical protein